MWIGDGIDYRIGIGLYLCVFGKLLDWRGGVCWVRFEVFFVRDCV